MTDDFVRSILTADVQPRPVAIQIQLLGLTHYRVAVELGIIPGVTVRVYAEDDSLIDALRSAFWRVLDGFGKCSGCDGYKKWGVCSGATE